MFRSAVLTMLITFGAMAVMSFSKATAQDEDFHALGVNVTGQTSPGYYLIGEACSDSFAILDNAGRYMYRAPLETRSNLSAYKNKWITYFTSEVGQTMYIRRNIDLEFIDTLRSSPPYVSDFHEIRIVSDSSYYVLGREIVILDLSSTVPGGRRDVQVVSAVIEERTFSGNTLFLWRSIEHIPVTDASETIDLTASAIDYIHINSIAVASDGNLLLSCRHLSEVIKVNRATGEIMWRLGGSDSKNNQFTFLNDTKDGYVGFSFQHSAAETADGTLLLFDNGNTKPTAESRAVEYQLDEVAKTATRVWEYKPSPPMYANNMGNVQELENGNVLIGYGSGSTNVVAHEVDRDGVVQAQITNNEEANFSAYRVLKCELYMTGVFRRITAPGNISFTRNDSTTYVSANITRVDAPTSVVVERHSYEPHLIAHGEGAACGVIPMRWTVRFKHLNRVGGTLSLDLGSISLVEYPNMIKLYHRPVEGVGGFTQINATYSAATKQLTTAELLSGEYMLAYKECFPPLLVTPLDGVVEVDTVQTLTWTAAVGSGEYMLEVSKNNNFNVVHLRANTFRLDTTIAKLARGTTYYWRIRARTTTGYGPWSSVFRFTTKMLVPKILSPMIAKDTIAVLRSTPFSWNTVEGADGYRIRVERTEVAEKVLDTTVVGSSFVPSVALLSNTSYTWTVAATKGTITGAASKTEKFITALAAPELQKPEPDAVDVETVNVTFRWLPVATAIRYVFTVIRANDGVVVVRDSTIKGSMVVAALQAGTRYEWTCYAVGRYGRGEQASPQFFITTSSIKLQAPIVIGPRSTNNVDTIDVRFSWEPVVNATHYDVQLTSQSSFSSSDTTVYDLTSTSWTAPQLKPGKVYGWRVIARAVGSVSSWSDTSMFTTKARGTDGLTPVVPVVGSIDVPLSGIFQYTTSTKYSMYTVSVDTSMTFNDPLTFVSNNGSCQYTGLTPATTYYWRVRGRVSSGSPVDGAIGRFTTVDATTGIDADQYDLAITVSLVGNELVVAQMNELVSVQSVDVYSIQGKRVLTHEWPGGTINPRIETTFDPGVYVVRLRTNDPDRPVTVYTVFQGYR
ncbi:MAG: aryl-sulfate sulfotransferase [Ignavibacteria bacterium]|nr:aryl-sulfate sulfotransferase [Ignavibacteria bacterium]